MWIELNSGILMTARKTQAPRRAGFTFIEVLIAMLIFTMVVVSALGIIRGSVRATQESKDISTATWLLQSKMVELETHLDTLGPNKACDKKKTGKFDAPNQRFSWLTNCNTIDFHLPDATALMPKDKDKQNNDDAATTENQIQKMIVDAASEYISKSLLELHAEVTWQQGKTTRRVTATTEWARYDQTINLPGLGSLGTPQQQQLQQQSQQPNSQQPNSQQPQQQQPQQQPPPAYPH